MKLKILYILYKGLKVTKKVKKNHKFAKKYIFSIFLNIDISYIKIGVFGVAKFENET